MPDVYGYDEAASVWLQEDLGDTTLFDALVQARARDPGEFPPAMESIYRRVLTDLPRFQVEGGRRIDFGAAYPRDAFDEQSIRWDLNYFKYHFLKLAHIPFSEQLLEHDFDALTGFLLRADASHFLYRDFQSRNIMLREGSPWFIDFQGGRRGALHYDVASLLYDAKADLPMAVRGRLLDHYLDALAGHVAVDAASFRELFQGFVVVRVLQALGAYGYRGFYERKPRFLQSVPHAARNLGELVEDGLPVSTPELEAVFRRIVERYAGYTEDEQEAGLTVRVISFSYRRGYPQDSSGHGGGFVFDCRALPNPGRHLRYSDRSGLDESVIQYIEAREESHAFWRGVQQMVDAQVEEYLRRGFSSLTVSFGCTGGQHRSVYMAERLAAHLQTRFPQVHVRLSHRERDSWPGPPLDARSGPDEREARGQAWMR